MVYYNEFDRKAAAWLRTLISMGCISKGEVDERSIVDVRPDDLRGFTRCHFFAGIGGWDYALQLAGWPEDYPVWTGSCPCQPFSEAGKKAEFSDERHLWPIWKNLIGISKPAIVFGEQVESGPARAWLDLVCADMEADGYAFASGVLPAASVGAPQGRHRIRRGKNGRLHVANLCDQLVDIGRRDLVRSSLFRCLLMGYPTSWEDAADMAMPSFRKSRRPLSKRT